MRTLNQPCQWTNPKQILNQPQIDTKRTWNDNPKPALAVSLGPCPAPGSCSSAVSPNPKAPAATSHKTQNLRGPEARKTLMHHAPHQSSRGAHAILRSSIIIDHLLSPQCCFVASSRVDPQQPPAPQISRLPFAGSSNLYVLPPPRPAGLPPGCPTSSSHCGNCKPRLPYTRS